MVLIKVLLGFVGKLGLSQKMEIKWNKKFNII